MTPNEYQEAATKFASYGGNSMYPILGLAEEAGEVCGKVAKYIRKHDGFTPLTGTPDEDIFHSKDFAEDVEFRANIEKELGDCLWMIAEICTQYDLKLEDVMRKNIEKLTDRRNRGVIVGEGDNR